jgi:succinate dehydrogenase/fumarate reductase flavoprotein subunit
MDRPARSVDVLVVGFGCAGTCAAIEAAATAETLLVEAAPLGGGTSAASHAILYLGGGTAIQRACGFEDSPEAMYRYLMAACGPDPDPKLIEPYCEHSVEHFEWLCAQGVPFKPSYFPHGHFPESDDGLVYSGNERVHPFRELARPAPRGHIPRTRGPAGGLLMQKLTAAVTRSGAQVLLGARCEALVREDDGRVSGALFRSGTHTRFIEARRGLVLTTGGFIWNDAMLRQYAPDLLRCQHRVGTPSDDGSGIRLGMAAGAEAIGLDRGDVLLPLYPPPGLKRGLLVDRQGKRFINEDAYHGRIGELALHECGGEVWMIIDSSMDERPQNTPAPLAAVEESPAALEAALGMTPGSLQSTIERYNEAARRGLDPCFHKASEFVTPLEHPPYAALDLCMESAHYGGFTLGGLHIDAWGHALSASGDPVPGLFAAGRASSGVAKRGYSSGLSLGDASFFGRRAGRRAASG